LEAADLATRTHLIHTRALQGNCSEPPDAQMLKALGPSTPELLPLKPRQCLIISAMPVLQSFSENLWLDNVYFRQQRQLAEADRVFAEVELSAETLNLLPQHWWTFLTNITIQSDLQGDASALRAYKNTHTLLQGALWGHQVASSGSAAEARCVHALHATYRVCMCGHACGLPDIGTVKHAASLFSLTVLRGPPAQCGRPSRALTAVAHVGMQHACSMHARHQGLLLCC
jgi:hypothetical protein